ncbi:MaoC family dehydratase N-terminal domain-containing protein [Allokutzneria sp. A3M-2-11 16]|uniref:FAS1-like dehydratase domain-containing protein n=1 Tax=Allokutzneria sp. A3M-2-11 16 TaxID=2962043 RepID=UPI0020B78AD2|nr:MaoC family dehydratase N-terminal domain-containing protein [Allokutzneria sp. A3M-2-11 16]MCP3805298.1 MaoC family dehydratase N-terminal domain-containing protein [Allokutzneria sp. A3M-2-11 16]
MKGLRLAPFTTRVGRDRVRRFALAVGEQRPSHVDVAAARAAGYPDLPLPPTMLFGIEVEHRGDEVLEAMGYDPNRALHTEQRFTYHADVFAEEELVFSSVITDVYNRKAVSMDFVVQDTSVARDGVVVVEFRHVLAIGDAS